MKTRTDIHRPSAIVPGDYEFVAFDSVKLDSIGACEFVISQREVFAAHRAKTGGLYAGHSHAGSCYVCGASAVYTVIFYHEKSNAYIKTGQDCAQKLEMSYGDMNYFRKQIKDALHAVAGKKKAQAVLAEAGFTKAWDIYLGSGDEALLVGGYAQREEGTIRDIVGKLVKYGSVSEKQLAFVGSLLKRIEDRPAIAAKRAAEREAAADVPVGRVTISGEVVSFKDVPTDFGMVTKMLVKAETGFKVFGTCNFDCNRGDRVQFVATVEASQDDKKFGFFKRPTKGVVLIEGSK